jgi:hypothetical protein
LTAWSLLLCATAGLSQLVFPIRYGDLLSQQPSSLLAACLLAARNLLLVVLAVLAWRECLRQTRVPVGSLA